MASQWYVQVMGEVLGPLSDDGLREMVAKRQLTPDDMVGKGSSANWVPAARVRGLFSQSPVATTAQIHAISSSSPSDAEAVRVATSAENHAVPKFREVTKPAPSYLVDCPDCRKRISPNANSCPNCGYV